MPGALRSVFNVYVSDAAGAPTLDSTSTFTYDDRNRLETVRQAGLGAAPGYAGSTVEKFVAFAYGQDGRFENIRRYAGENSSGPLVAETTYTYDYRNRLQSLVHAGPVYAPGQGSQTSTLASYGFTYDELGRIQAIASPQGSSTYSYDLADQLTSANYTAGQGTPAPENETYQYDAAGNRIGLEVNAHNRLANDGTYAYTYDAEGNRLTRTEIVTGHVTTYAWDARQRLVGVGESAAGGGLLWHVAYVYDVHNRWIATRLDADGAGPGAAEVTQQFVYDGSQIAVALNGEGQVTSSPIRS